MVIKTMRGIELSIKRCIDIVCAGIVLVLLLPLWGIIALIMKLTMPGPLFFKQERIGKNFKPFMVLKFRTMKVDKEAEKQFKIEKDRERTTAFGKFLRRTKLDETPQVINVLKGDMSIVGPRPTVRQRVEEYSDGQDVRLSLRPGMTGLSQTRGGVVLSWPKRIEYDCEYVNKFSLFLDFTIILKTVGVVLMGEDKFISNEDRMKYMNPIYKANHQKD